LKQHEWQPVSCIEVCWEFAVSFVGHQCFQVRCYLSVKFFSLEASNCIAIQQYMASLSKWLSLLWPFRSNFENCTLLGNYAGHSSSNTPEECSSCLLPGRSLKSHWDPVLCSSQHKRLLTQRKFIFLLLEGVFLQLGTVFSSTWKAVLPHTNQSY